MARNTEARFSQVEMLKNKSAFLISIGPEINTDEDGIYSKDMQVILDHVEKKMQTKFYFHYGAMLILGKTQLKPFWLPHS